MRNRIKEINTALPGLLVGILLFGILCQIAGVIYAGDKINYSVGLWIGVFTAIFMAFHMAVSLNTVVERDVKGAQAAATRQNMIRYLVVILIFGVLMLTRVGSPLAAFAGVMGLKVSAYLQPFLSRMAHHGKGKQFCDNTEIPEVPMTSKTE